MPLHPGDRDRQRPWFVAVDVCKVLGIANASKAAVNLTQGDVCNLKIPGQRGHPNKMVSESGLYALVMRSNKPKSKAFQDWVTGTVLPSIRKDGAIIKRPASTAPSIPLRGPRRPLRVNRATPTGYPAKRHLRPSDGLPAPRVSPICFGRMIADGGHRDPPSPSSW